MHIVSKMLHHLLLINIKRRINSLGYDDEC